ncbi:MAG: copper amine oxidase, partial [Candidatus Desulforudis sp.]|nr:copper amine oxidase [Desulforudis sp.]
TMWLQGAVVNRPSSGAERRLANAFLVRYGVPVYLNETLLFFDVPALLDERGGRTMVPLRGIFEAVGAEVVWDQQTKRVTATRDGRTVSLVVGDKTAYVNGTAYQMDVPAGIYRDRTLVPLRFVGESLGAAVHWEAEPPTVYLSL